MAGGRGSGEIYVFDTASGKLRSILTGHRDAVACLSFLADGTLLSGGEDGTVRHWDVASEACRLHFTAVAEGRVRALRASAELVWVTGSFDGVRAFALATGELRHALSGRIALDQVFDQGGGWWARQDGAEVALHASGSAEPVAWWPAALESAQMLAGPVLVGCQNASVECGAPLVLALSDATPAT